MSFNETFNDFYNNDYSLRICKTSEQIGRIANVMKNIQNDIYKINIRLDDITEDIQRKNITKDYKLNEISAKMNSITSVLFGELKPETEDEATIRECSICMEELTDDSNIKVTTCMHVYHRHCLDRWLIKKNTCPECRTIINDF